MSLLHLGDDNLAMIVQCLDRDDFFAGKLVSHALREIVVADDDDPALERARTRSVMATLLAPA